jgi:hypothetical protein
MGISLNGTTRNEDVCETLTRSVLGLHVLGEKRCTMLKPEVATRLFGGCSALSPHFEGGRGVRKLQRQNCFLLYARSDRVVRVSLFTRAPPDKSVVY